MKLTRSLVTVILVVLMIVGWMGAIFGNDSGENDEHAAYVEMAEEYVDRGLYQKAIQEYENAISIKSTEEDWIAILDTYEKRYAESTKIYKDYLAAAKQAVSSYGENTDFIKTLVDLYLKRDEYKEAYKCLTTAVDSGINDDEISALQKEVQYSFELNWKAYIDFRSCTNGFYAVSSAGIWTYITQTGGDTTFTKLEFAGSVGEAGIRVIYENERGQLIDANEVVQGLFDFMPEDAGVYSEELVAIKKDGKYAYYNSLGDMQFGSYSNASSFLDGKAAVQEESWYLINYDGEKVSANIYEDIVINSDLTYLKNDLMIAKKDGAYHFYDSNEEQIGNFSCSEIDTNTSNGWIAFCRDDKWGFVDEEGNEVTEPLYDKAKSFSYGLAAVYNGETWGFINTDGDVVIDYRFLSADYFNSDGYCMVETGTDTFQLISLYILE